MSTLAFINEFKALHDKAKNGTLSPSERARYDVARLQFSRVVVIAQQLGHAGETLRATLRMAKMLKVEIQPDGGQPARASTIDLASGGFAVLMPVKGAIGSMASFTLHLPSPSGGGTAPLSGRCAVASARSQGSVFRVSYRFQELAAPEQERLTVALIDAVLERFTPS